MAPVSVRDVRKSYGQQIVIHGVDLEIADGEFVVLVGPSGCGKSTLLRMVAGLEPISSGDIAIDGRIVNETPPRDRDIAMVFQNYALYPHMSVAANMGFSLMLKKAGQAEITARVTSAADILGLGALLHRYPRELSGGQRQRVAMGRAIVRNPKVFLFDEPLSNLDAKLRIEMRAEIKGLHHRLKTTTIYVTHDQIEAMTLADRIVVLHDGVVQQIGGPLDLYDRPHNTFVATFIGSPSMNLLEGNLGQQDGKSVFRLLDGTCLPVGAAAVGSLGSKAVCGIRPEDFAVSPHGLPATVQVFEPLGSESQIVARLAGQDVVVLLRDRQAYAPGDTITLQPDPSRLHLFNAASGMRLDASRADLSLRPSPVTPRLSSTP